MTQILGGQNEDQIPSAKRAQNEISDVLSHDQKLRSEDNEAQLGNQSVEIFKNEFDKSVATAERVD